MDNGGVVNVHSIQHCANIQCPNEASQGTMAIVNMPFVVTPGRTITLVMCSPCARALYEKVRTDA